MTHSVDEEVKLHGEILCEFEVFDYYTYSKSENLIEQWLADLKKHTGLRIELVMCGDSFDGFIFFIKAIGLGFELDLLRNKLKHDLPKINAQISGFNINESSIDYYQGLMKHDNRTYAMTPKDEIIYLAKQDMFGNALVVAVKNKLIFDLAEFYENINDRQHALDCYKTISPQDKDDYVRAQERIEDINLKLILVTLNPHSFYQPSKNQAVQTENTIITPKL